uniref:C2 domain-containing protein n=1 Tax=Cyclophora tenuis TaxID=216820 RepID=A0A7S1D9E5_CYCTE|mmetsp:Transcript_5229/g.9045  ORF Transcript_5229/g.9045 Transcript_5229/m.9045 type:complete len:329 (+) Transcript_5229:668-1654(+)|eukprot:CAMPEP_0116565268 /NCGR_PEP_ID=MMETSP0397-20121206/13804_1 /TAXON_ID=216820 /ORGANISM="Cyclophora tenuis, Strain ECT3854" /LENGTH=328 /DNA_ID=CAMNT_0004092023 /DNA_START=617 /DNA_END=1603 /DNA_ORIENTATION=-
MKLRLWLSAEKLPSPPGKKVFGNNKLNAFAILSEIGDSGSVLGIKRHRLQTTEVVPQTSSPEWQAITEFEHRSHTEHRLSVDVFHSDVGPLRNESTITTTTTTRPTMTRRVSHRGVPTPEAAQQLCSLFFDVETILSQKDYFILEPIPGSQGGSVTVRLEVVKADVTDFAKSVLRFQLRGSNLGNVVRRGMPSYHFEVRRKHMGRTQEKWCLVYRSETVPSNSNPVWAMMIHGVALDTLCHNHDLDEWIQISIVDVSANWATLGTVETTVREFMERGSEMGPDTEKGLLVTNGKKQRKVGHLVVAQCEVIAPPTEEIPTTPRISLVAY